jgi:hypothetical protein
MNLLNEVDKPKVTKTVVVYSGRFQPFHRGHYASYKKLVSKFGAGNVYIGTSNDTSGTKSPFNFSEKKKIATTMFGIPDDKFVQIRNPYQPTEILKKFDGQTTQYIAAVGEKDSDRLQGKYFKPYKGKSGYGYDEIGYVYAVPPEPNPISGTDVRNNLGSDDIEKAKKFFLVAYPKFNQKIFDMITKKIKGLNEYGALRGTGMAGDFGPSPVKKSDDEEVEEGLPGGAFVGLVSPQGYIGGAPDPKDVSKLSKKLHKKDDEDSHKKYVYDPIAEIISNIVTEEVFNEFIESYFGEAENPVMDKEISYKKADGSDGKIKVRDALRLKKDHPAHIEAKKMIGQEKPEPTAKKEKPEGEKSKEGDEKGETEKGGKEPEAGANKPEPNKLSGSELKSAAEQTPQEKHESDIKQQLDKEKSNLSSEDSKAIDSLNNPKSPERKGLMDKLKSGAKALGNGVKHMLHHKKEMIGDSFSAVKSLATTGKIGSVKDEKGRDAHWSDFAKKDSKGKAVMEDVPVFKKDKHGHTVKDDKGNPVQDTDKKGRPKTEKKPVFSDTGALPHEEKKLFEKSWEASKKQKKGLVGLAKETALLVGSIAVTGGIMGGASAAAKGAGVGGVLKGAGAKIAYKFGGGHFGSYLAKDIVKHSAFESLGASGLQASAGGIALGAAGIFEITGNDKIDSKKFMQNYIAKTIETIKNYKLSDKQIIDAIKRYKKEEPKLKATSNASDLLKEEAISKSKVENIADFVKYSTERLKLKNKPKVKLLLGRQYAEQNSSLGGYSPETKDIVVVVPKRMTADICRTIAHELVHRKQDEMGLVGNSAEAGKTGSPVENQANAVAGILLRDYGKKNKQIYAEGAIISEVSRLSVSDSDRPDGAYLPKGAKRKLGANDGVNLSDHWFHNGGYIQLEFPEADQILGDDDANQIIVKYVTKNVPRMTGEPTKFTKNPEKTKIINEMSRNDIHFKNIFQYWRDGSAKEKQKIAYVVTGNKFAKSKEIVKALMELDYDEIKELEDELKISPFNEHSEAGGWVGPNAGPWVDDETAEDINVPVNPGDEVLMGKFKNKRVTVKDIGSDKHGMPTINGKQATTFRTINEGNYIVGSMQNDQSFRSPYTDKWERFDDRAKTHAEIVGFTVHSHTSDHYPQKKNGVVMPSRNPSEENGPGKRWIHPVKGIEYEIDKKIKWEMYPFNSRPQAYKPPPAVGTQVNIFNYTAPNMIKENMEETKQLIMEGGAYGHMSHPFDDMNLTFGDLKDIIGKALDGELGIVREKTDGQALAISWKNGRLIAARNKGHLANAGASAMGIEDVATKFANRGGLTDAYNFAMRDLTVAIGGLSEKQKEKIFQNGKCFMNLEVIWPTSVNVIPYGQSLLIFHNTTCYDETGKAIAADQTAARTLAGMIKQVNADVQSKYTIQGPPVTEIPKSKELSSKKGKYLSKLSKLQSKFGLSDSDTVSVYHQSWWENFIDTKAPVKVDKITKEALVRRWAFGDKSFKINTISNPELKKWADDNDKVNVIKQQKDNVKPFEEIFLGVGADVLEFVGSVLTVHPDKAIRNMKQRLVATADQVRTAGSATQIQKLKTELGRLNQLGGIDRIVASEGLVFFYNGKTYKLTGTFAPLNQILGIFYE